MTAASGHADIFPFTLANGLTLIVAPRSDTGVLTLDCWVRVGSADEPPALHGASHFLEHMLFKGTDRFQVGEIDRMVEGVGGVVNAATSHDFTHYYITAAAGEFPVAMTALSDMLQHARLDPQEVDRERQVILEEYRIKQDHPMGVLWESLYDTAFEQGPYKHSVLGTPDSLEAIGSRELRDYYNRHYAPHNIAIMMVGDIDPQKAAAWTAPYFSDFTRPYRPSVDKTPATRMALAPEKYLEKEVKESYCALALPAPALLDYDEVVALDVVQFLLGGGHSSLLYQEIKEKRQLVSAIHMGFSSARYPDLLYVFYTCPDENREPVNEAVLEIFDRLTQEKPGEKELNRAKKLLCNEHAFSLETTGGQSGSIGYYYTITGGIAFEQHYAERVQAVTAEKALHAAQKWFSARDHLCRVAVRPKSS